LRGKGMTFEVEAKTIQIVDDVLARGVHEF